jgi:hypothetical protein
MQKELLNDFWLTSEPIDFEYKKYLMLAYDQSNSKDLSKKKIYPNLTDIVDKLMYVNGFLKNMTAFEESAQDIDRIDWLKKEIVYKTKINDNSFDDIKTLAYFSHDILFDLFIRFKNLYDYVDGSIVISGNKFSIFDKYSGYLILKYGGKEKIFNYEIYKTILTDSIFHLKTSKASLKEYYSDRYTKNIFEVIVKEGYPAKETTIPVIRRKFLMYILGGYFL